MNARASWLLVTALAAAPAIGADGAHVHGTAALDVGIEGSQLSQEFAALLQDLVGFESEALNDKERAALERLVSTSLGSGQAFVPGADAGCKPGGASVATSSPAEGHAEVRQRRSTRAPILGVSGA